MSHGIVFSEAMAGPFALGETDPSAGRERGREGTPQTYPRDPGDAWLWDNDEPARVALARKMSSMSQYAGKNRTSESAVGQGETST